METLLGTKKRIKTMVKFLEKSGVFTKTGTKNIQKTMPTIDNKENRRRIKRDREEIGGLVEDKIDKRE